MTNLRRGARLGSALVSCAVLICGQANAQTVTPTDTLSSVDVVAPKKKTGIEAMLPGTDQRKSATCEVLVMYEPGLLDQMKQALELFNPLMGPTINLPTRRPRNPDLTNPPVTAPGSALPDITRRSGRPLEQGAPTAISAGAGAVSGEGGDGAAAADDAMGTSPNAEAILACRMLFARGDKETDAKAATEMDARGRAEASRYNKTLPMAFELFDHGRYEEALVWFKDSYKVLTDAHGGDEAALMVGKIYLLGLRTKADPKEAVVWLKRAAEAPFSVSRDRPVFDPLDPEQNTAIGEAAVMLGNLYLRGYAGIEKNPEEARKWFARAAYVGHVPAAKILGDLYAPSDAKKAVQYYNAAAVLNLASAQVALADLYYAGAPGVPADIPAALGWYNQAAKQNHPNALYALAVAYDTGEGVAADQDKALGFYKAAALKGHAEAQAALGSYFYDGVTVAKDLPTARQWFEAAAKGGDADAMFNLGVMMMKGEGGAKDQALAWVWLKLAQKGGVGQTAAALTALEGRMTPDEKQTAAKLYAPQQQS